MDRLAFGPGYLLTLPPWRGRLQRECRSLCAFLGEPNVATLRARVRAQLRCSSFLRGRSGANWGNHGLWEGYSEWRRPVQHEVSKGGYVHCLERSGEQLPGQVCARRWLHYKSKHAPTYDYTRANHCRAHGRSDSLQHLFLWWTTTRGQLLFVFRWYMHSHDPKCLRG